MYSDAQHCTPTANAAFSSKYPLLPGYPIDGWESTSEQCLEQPLGSKEQGRQGTNLNTNTHKTNINRKPPTAFLVLWHPLFPNSRRNNHLSLKVLSPTSLSAQPETQAASRQALTRCTSGQLNRGTSHTNLLGLSFAVTRSWSLSTPS